jgi:mannose-6-phosphate isomerase class I
VQDVKDILSIQVHPSKEEAEKGFAREEAKGIPIKARIGIIRTGTINPKCWLH